MLPRFQNRELKAKDKAIITKVEKFGWMVTNIKDEPGKPGWSYTTGLFEHYQHPKVIIFSLEAGEPPQHSQLGWRERQERGGLALCCEGRGAEGDMLGSLLLGGNQSEGRCGYRAQLQSSGLRARTHPFVFDPPRLDLRL